MHAIERLACNKSWTWGASHLTPLWLLLYLCTGEFCPCWIDLERTSNGDSIVICCLGVVISMHAIERLACNKSWTWGASHLTPLWLLFYLCTGEFCPCWIDLERTNNGESIVFCCLGVVISMRAIERLACHKSWTWGASHLTPLWLLLYLCTGEFCPCWIDLERTNNGESIVFCCLGVVISMHAIERLACHKSWTWGASHLTPLWLLFYLCTGEFCPCWIDLERTNNGESIVFCCLGVVISMHAIERLACHKSWTWGASHLTPLWLLFYLCTGEFCPCWIDLERTNNGESIVFCCLGVVISMRAIERLACHKSWTWGASHLTPLWLLFYLCTGEFCPCWIDLERTNNGESIVFCCLGVVISMRAIERLACHKSWTWGASHLTPLWLLFYLCTGEFCPCWIDLERTNNGESIVFCCLGVVISMRAIERLACHKSWTWGASHLTPLWLLFYLCTGEFCPCWIDLERTNNGESIVFCCLGVVISMRAIERLACHKSWTWGASHLTPLWLLFYLCTGEFCPCWIDLERTNNGESIVFCCLGVVISMRAIERLACHKSWTWGASHLTPLWLLFYLCTGEFCPRWIDLERTNNGESIVFCCLGVVISMRAIERLACHKSWTWGASHLTPLWLLFYLCTGEFCPCWIDLERTNNGESIVFCCLGVVISMRAIERLACHKS